MNRGEICSSAWPGSSHSGSGAVPGPVGLEVDGTISGPARCISSQQRLHEIRDCGGDGGAIVQRDYSSHVVHPDVTLFKQRVAAGDAKRPPDVRQVESFPRRSTCAGA